MDKALSMRVSETKVWRLPRTACSSRIAVRSGCTLTRFCTVFHRSSTALPVQLFRLRSTRAHAHGCLQTPVDTSWSSAA
eukprot:tig00000037_g10106.t1